MNTKLRDKIEKIIEENKGDADENYDFYGTSCVESLLTLFLEEYRQMAEGVIGEDSAKGSPEANSEWNELRQEQRQRLESQIKSIKEGE